MASAFDGCSARYTHQAGRLSDYVGALQECVAEKDPRALGFLMESAVVMMVSFLEEYLTSVVYDAAFYREHDVRRYLSAEGNPQERQLASTCNAGTLCRFMTTRVSFKNNARRLEAAFDFLFGFSPWPDTDTARLVRDLVRVRNVVIHAGGWPNASHFREMETPGIIVQTSKDPDFFRLESVNAARTLLSAISAAGKLPVFIAEHLGRDERWTYSFPPKPFPPDRDTLDDD